jgi:hypothetical protein
MRKNDEVARVRPRTAPCCKLAVQMGKGGAPRIRHLPGDEEPGLAAAAGTPSFFALRATADMPSRPFDKLMIVTDRATFP